MGLLNSQIAADATLAFTDLDGGFAEQITYIPAASTLTRLRAAYPSVWNAISQLAINAVIVRETPERLLGTNQDVKQRIMVIVANDPVLSISSAFIDYGGDKVSFQRRLGEAPTTHSISQRANQETNDPGMLCLEV